jgi:hypothetical protein
MARYLRLRGAAVLKGCGLVSAAFLVMAAAGPAPAWTISAVQAAQAPNGTLVAESCPAPGTCMAVGSSHAPGGQSLALAELRHGSAWTALPTPNPGDGHGSALTAVSCESTSACTAVGSYRNGVGTPATLAETWNGTTWRIQPTPNPAGSFGSYLTGVSCAAAGACTAVGYYYSQSFQDGPVAFAESWDGQAWTIQQVPGEGGSPTFLYAVSCASPAACVAVGSYSGPLGSGLPLAEVWNGTSWTAQAPAVPDGGFVALTGVSCTAATACTAVGNYSQNHSPFAQLALAEAWNGTAWALKPTPDPGGYADLNAVSCASATACTAVGWTGPGFEPKHALAETWNGSTWTAQAPAQPPGAADSQLAGVSCSAAACAAVGSAYRADPGAWRTLAEARPGSAWAIQASPSPRGAVGTSVTGNLVTSPLTGVSCAAAASCVAVGSVARAWNGTTWAPLAIARPPGATNITLGGVSCTTASACMAVGSYADASGALRPLAESWDGSSWRVEPAVSPPGATSASLAAVSCTAASACMAVGGYGGTSGFGQTLAESWNGTSWRLRATINPGTRNNLLAGVSCPAASACIAVGQSDGLGPLAEGWNGSAWSQQTTARLPVGLSSVSCTAASACAAVGTSGSRPGVGTWDGSTWTIRGLPLPAGTFEAQLNGVSCPTASDCTAVGFSYANGGGILTLAETWNGTVWAIQPTANPPHAQLSGLYGVSCTAASACTGVGTFGPLVAFYGVDVPLAEQRP